MRDIDAAWLAGLLDGEGTFRAKKICRERGKSIRRHQAFIEISMTNRAVLEHARTITGIGTVKPQSKLTKRGKQVWRWCVVSRGAGVVARAVLPYLIVKRQQAELLIALCDSLASRPWGDPRPVALEVLDWRDECQSAISALNQL